MKGFMFGFSIIVVCGDKFAVSKFSYTLDIARAIYKDMVAEKLEKHVEFEKDPNPKDGKEMILCVTVPYTEGTVHPALAIVKKHGKDNATSRQAALAAELMA